MQSFIESLQPYLLIVMTLCALHLVFSNRKQPRSHFANNNSPWTVPAALVPFMSESSASNQRQGFESMPLSMRLSSVVHGADNFVGSLTSKLSGALSGRGGFVGSLASKLSGALSGRENFEGPNVTAPIKASGAAAQLAALLKK